MNGRIAILKLRRMTLYHGTTERIADEIVDQGFEVSTVTCCHGKLSGMAFTNQMDTAQNYADVASKAHHDHPVVVYARIRRGTWADLRALSEKEMPSMRTLQAVGVSGALVTTRLARGNATEFLLFNPDLATLSGTGEVTPP